MPEARAALTATNAASIVEGYRLADWAFDSNRRIGRHGKHISARRGIGRGNIEPQFAAVAGG